MTLNLKRFLFLVCGSSYFAGWAANRGPVFPTHRFPTDESYHLGFDFGYLGTNSNFVSGSSNQLLLDASSVKVLRGSLRGEFQPNRRFSAGFFVNWDRVTLKNPTLGESFYKSKFSDNFLFGEYRYFDVPGGSLGFAVVAKFPTYKNPNLIDLGSPNPEKSVFLGDGQTDLSFLLTQEFWPGKHVRIRGDFGLTQRFSGFASEIPLQIGFGFVTHKVDFNLGLRGNFSMGSKTTPEELSDLSELRSAFGDSKYALAQNPWGMNLEPQVDLWLSPKYAFNFKYSYSLFGGDSAKFNEFAVGLTYRWAQRKSNQKKTFQQVDITTDQDAGVFQAEIQGKESEPKFVDPNPIKEPESNDEEFF